MEFEARRNKLTLEDLAIRVESNQPNFQKEINAALVRNQAPYTLHHSTTLGWGITQTGTLEERKAVLAAFQDLQEGDLAIPREHFEKAGRHLAKDKEACDAVRESTMALEALLKILTNKPNASLGSILETEWKLLEIPSSLNPLFKAMWQYRSKAPGVGHSGKTMPLSPSTSRWEAQLIYVFSCAAASYFINKRRDKERV